MKERRGKLLMMNNPWISINVDRTADSEVAVRQYSHFNQFDELPRLWPLTLSIYLSTIERYVYCRCTIAGLWVFLFFLAKKTHTRRGIKNHWEGQQEEDLPLFFATTVYCCIVSVLFLPGATARLEWDGIFFIFFPSTALALLSYGPIA